MSPEKLMTAEGVITRLISPESYMTDEYQLIIRPVEE